MEVVSMELQMDESEAESSVGMRKKEELRMTFRVLVFATGSSAESVMGEKTPRKVTAYFCPSCQKLSLTYQYVLLNSIPNNKRKQNK